MGSSGNTITLNTISNSGGVNIKSKAQASSSIAIKNNTFSGTGGKTDISENSTTGTIAIDADQLND